VKASKITEIVGKVEVAVGGLIKNQDLKAKGEEKIAQFEAAKNHNATQGQHSAAVHSERGRAHGGATIEELGGYAGQVPGTTGTVPHHANQGVY
jgi:hypothetical protein